VFVADFTVTENAIASGKYSSVCCSLGQATVVISFNHRPGDVTSHSSIKPILGFEQDRLFKKIFSLNDCKQQKIVPVLIHLTF